MITLDLRTPPTSIHDANSFAFLQQDAKSRGAVLACWEDYIWIGDAVKWGPEGKKIVTAISPVVCEVLCYNTREPFNETVKLYREYTLSDWVEDEKATEHNPGLRGS